MVLLEALVEEGLLLFFLLEVEVGFFAQVHDLRVLVLCDGQGGEFLERVFFGGDGFLCFLWRGLAGFEGRVVGEFGSFGVGSSWELGDLRGFSFEKSASVGNAEFS